MIHVAIFCAGSWQAAGRFCPPIEGTVPLAEVHAWYAKKLADHAWTVDDAGNTYCPRHSPAEKGAVVGLVVGEYRPLGDSGWEARMPEGAVLTADIEIRQRRGGDDG